MSDLLASRARLALPLAATALCLIPLLPAFGLGDRIGAGAPIGRDRPPEAPAGWAFAIWAPIFALYAGFSVLAMFVSTHLTRRLAGPLVIAGLAGAVWMLLRQQGAGALSAFPVLVAMTAASLLAAARYEAMRGLGGSPGKALADLLTGLMSGWLCVAVAVSLPGLVRPALALGPTDAVWPFLSMSLVALVILVRISRRLVTTSVWYRLAVGWGVLGMVANLWMATDLHVPAVATAAVGAWAILAQRAPLAPAPVRARSRHKRATTGP